MIEVNDLEVVFNEKESIDCKIKIETTKIKWKQIVVHFLMYADCHL